MKTAALRTPAWLVGSFVALGALLGSCGTLVGNPEDDDGKTPPKAAADVASVIFSLTDAPLDDAKGVFVTVVGLEVSKDGNEWISIPLKAATEVDLMQFQDGASTPLAETQELAVGTYQHTRLKLAAAPSPRIVLADDTSHDLEVEGDRTDLRIVTPFTVEAGAPVALTIDFDLRKSVRREHVDTGSDDEKGGKDHEKNDKGGVASAAGDRYILKPVLRMIRDDEAGSVSGDAADGKLVCVYVRDSAKDDADDCANSANSGRVKDGKYHIANLPKGDYEIRVFKNDGTVEDVTDVHVEKDADKEKTQEKEKD